MRHARLLVAALVAATGCRPAASPPHRTGSPYRATQVLAVWRAGADSLQAAVNELDSAVRSARSDADLAPLRMQFRAARQRFKLLEVALEYYAPSTTRGLNGSPVPEVEETEGPEVVLPPTGFQVLEALLHGPEPLSGRDAMLAETATLCALVRRARSMLAAQETTDAHVWDAARLELARVMTLGLAGFDASVSGDALREADAALLGLQRTLSPYRPPNGGWESMDRAFGAARAELQRSPSRESFDHFGFLTRALQPLAHEVAAARLALHIPVPADRRALRPEAASLFDANAIDPDAFALPGTDGRPERVDLGRMLFADARLSGPGTRACQSCHEPARAFTDGRVRAVGLRGERLARNTPTVINSGLQVGNFADLRTTYLEDQVTDVLTNPIEMHGSLEVAAARLRSDEAMRMRFRAAFPAAARDSLVTPLHIRQALASYMRSLSRLDAPVDRALRGDTTALTSEARAGFNVFVGKGRCASCHFLPLTNGTVPPMYQRSEVEVLGVPARAVSRGAVVDADPGRFGVTRAAPHRHAFRTPSVRNVALTAPYMHNGVYRTLAEVIAFYDRGGGAGIGASLEHQTLATDPLRLTAAERRSLRAFLGALTDTAGLR